MKEAPIPTK